MDKEMMKGSIDLLLLSLIEQRDLYGYEMTRILKRLSDETYEMSEGTLYAALKRMERKDWIKSYWKETDSGRRKYYHITKEGTKELELKKRNWKWMNELIRRSSEGLS
ncbi:PadR family transcriptional regulator [Pseudogracilibacillus auburnensis]|uniref:PadR family transcriptional regulator n=1 Tax=Pseudogracilibacillus auburnensis TaxID=1494959 RepID=A0A2V3VPM6_9BACI|nr:helix-turn-helix transcriptional regulator [Pseudogracilibacillus auburnensis]MBO1001358.1 helix-turn-helix transcriptional regulator [Pseudogracilibacillus auburnensis]PXW83766.1 PadR family transcriptional regulator [Pseudogracilibacillus auburnensis]